MPKIIKKILLGLLILVVLFIGTLAAIPYFFKDEIVQGVKDAVNENLNATVDFADVDISLFRSFPDVSLRVQDYTVTGTEAFEGVPLATGKTLGLSVDFWSVWNFGEVPLEIHSVDLEAPALNVIVLGNGQANYDIVKPTEDTTAIAFQVQLQSYSITDGKLVYDDRQGDIFVKIDGLDHRGKGDFTQDIFDLDTETSIAALTAEAGGITYLKKAKAQLDAGFNIDLPQSKYTLLDNDLNINELELALDGWVAMPDDDIDMDLTFSTPQSDFKNLLSMIPNAYTEGYENVKANGTFSLTGFAKGKYSEQPESYPAFKIDLKVNNADVKYPDLPMGITGINALVDVNSPTSNLNQMTVDISKFSLQVGNNPLEGYFKLRTPMTDPDVDTKIKGKIDLGDLARAFPMEGVTTLNGMLDMDVAVRTRMSTIDQGDYANVDMSGQAALESFDYVAEGLPSVRINAMRLAFTPRFVDVPNFDMKLGKSDLSGSGRIDNILAYFSPDATMKGKFTMRSNYFNADEWMPEEEATTPVGSTAPTSTEDEMFNRFDFTVDAAIAKLDYDVYELRDLVAKGNFTPSKLTASELSGKIGQSDFSTSGVLTNVWNYLFLDETLGGDLSLRSNLLNLNEFMTEEDTTAASEPILVPANINLKMDANIGTVLYDNMVLKNVQGGLTVANEAVRFDDVTANSLGGQMAVRGGYDTKNHEQPSFDLGLALQEVDFQQAFNTFNTFQAVAPIGKYIQGKFNTNLEMSSILGKDLMPNLTTLNMKGLLQTLSGTISGFAPLENVANKLNVAAFKNLSLQNTKNWFTVANGAVQLDEFEHQYQDIPMKIGGNHKISGDMDYYIVAKIPRAKIGSNPLGAAANSGLEFLGAEASKLGLNLDAGEFVNVRINIAGTLTDPKIGFKLLGTDGQASVKDAAVAKVTEEVKKVVDDAKDQAQAKFDEEKDKAEARAREEAAKLKADAEARAKAEADRLSAEAKKKAEAEAKKRLDEEAKKKLEEWNPLGKKKKGGGD